MRHLRFLSLVVLLGVFGCRTLPKSPGETPSTKPPIPVEPSAKARLLLVYIPYQAESALKLLPVLEQSSARVVLGLSPRFKPLVQDPAIKNRFLQLIKAGKLEVALQVPNAPMLPLLMNTDVAKPFLPEGSEVPEPEYSYPEDVSQILARAKADFFHAWGFTPKGVVLPQGAVSGDLISLLTRMNWTYAIVAASLAPSDNPLRYRNLSIWDATPKQPSPTLQVVVVDERLWKGGPSVDGFVQAIERAKAGGHAMLLPSDATIVPVDVNEVPEVGARSWITSDWSPWIGSSRKNQIWGWLRRTRDAIEAYKNSGDVVLGQLDRAFEEMWIAQNANYLSGVSDDTASQASSRIRQEDLKTKLANIFKVIQEEIPDDLFEITAASPNALKSTTADATFQYEDLGFGRERLSINDAIGDDKGNLKGETDVQKLELLVSEDRLDWTIILGTLRRFSLGSKQSKGALIDVYVDLNHQPNAGYGNFLPGRSGTLPSADAWEYALVFSATKAVLYQAVSTDQYEEVGTYPLNFELNQIHVSIPREKMRGNPKKWGYQALSMEIDPSTAENFPKPLMLKGAGLLSDWIDVPKKPTSLGLIRQPGDE